MRNKIITEPLPEGVAAIMMRHIALKTWEIVKIYVPEGRRERGMGSILVERAKIWADELGIDLCCRQPEKPWIADWMDMYDFANDGEWLVRPARKEINADDEDDCNCNDADCDDDTGCHGGYHNRW